MACQLLSEMARQPKKYKLDRRRALPPLLVALQDPTADLRSDAAWAIARLGNKRGLQPLLQVALNDPVDTVRQSAIPALAYLDDPRAVPLLLKLAQNKCANQIDRTLAINSLWFADTDTIPPLKAVMLDETDDVLVRAEAVECVSTLAEGPELMYNFVELLQHEAVELRFWAAYGLVTMFGLDLTPVLPVIDQVVAYDTAVAPGWWAVSRETVPMLENYWYQRFSICAPDDEDCGCYRMRTYLISSVLEYWDYAQQSRRISGDVYPPAPFEQHTDLVIDTAWLAKALAQQWPAIGINVREPQSEALLLDWRLNMANGLLLGGLHRDRQCVFLTGNEHDVAEFALWYRRLIAPEHGLRLYGWADPGRELAPDMTPEQLVAALHDYPGAGT